MHLGKFIVLSSEFVCVPKELRTPNQELEFTEAISPGQNSC
jgi:hypothetical protein